MKARNCMRKDFRLSVAVCDVELWDADTGEIESVKFEKYDSCRTSVGLRLKPDEGRFLVVK